MQEVLRRVKDNRDDDVVKDIIKYGIPGVLCDLLLCKRVLEIEGQKWELVSAHHIPLLINGDETIWPVPYEFVDVEYQQVTLSNVMDLVSASNSLGMYAHTVNGIIEKMDSPHLEPLISKLADEDGEIEINISDNDLKQWVINSISLTRMYKMLERVL